MKGGKDTAMIILGKGKSKKRSDDDMEDMEYEDDEDDEDWEEEYSDEQHEMAEELISAVKKGDSEGLVNYPLSIDGIKFTVLITEKEDNISLSFRSKDDWYVNKIANEHFNGGGHIYAAGGALETSLEEAISKVEEVIKLKR